MKPSPRVVRNFYVLAQVDGMKSPISGGPRLRDGGLTLTLYQRSGGNVETALKLNCFARCDGTLRVEVNVLLPWSFDETDGQLRIETKR
jgi:hypothetical protein